MPGASALLAQCRLADASPGKIIIACAASTERLLSGLAARLGTAATRAAGQGTAVELRRDDSLASSLPRLVPTGEAAAAGPSIPQRPAAPASGARAPAGPNPAEVAIVREHPLVKQAMTIFAGRIKDAKIEVPAESPESPPPDEG